VQLSHEEVLLIHLPVGYGVCYGYIPRAPKVLESSDIDALTDFGKEQDLDFIKIDGDTGRIFERSSRLKKSWSPQPQWTRVLDLTLQDEELLKQMKRKGRYNIQLAKKRGISTECFQGEQALEKIDQWQQLLEETTGRDGFSGHNRSFYESFLKEIKHSQLILAKKEDQYIAAAIMVYHQDTAVYYYGVSSSQYRKDMAPYAVQWTGIQEGKKRGCKTYDFFGVAGPDEKNSDWAGITAFKEKFGGELVHRPSTQDLIISRPKYWWYKILKAGQKLIKRR
jgi:lipid II:glycine glycyltransferase (peptidoglycan interpeptide bridge formation enzyme)